MNKTLLAAVPLLAIILLAACNQPAQETTEQEQSEEMTSTVMTATDQGAMTPQAVLDDLMAGNQRYMQNDLTARDLPAQVAATTDGQYPKAIILSCVDSRVPVEMVFDQGVGDVFVARVAGNIEDEDLLGSIEYAVGVAGSKLVMVLGHESCGAVKSAVDQLDVGSENVDHLLAQIEPAIEKTEGERDAANKEYLTGVIKNNVELTIEDIRSRSAIVRQLEEEGKIMLAGGYYNLHDGSVTLLD
mgnify:CR=1 FL=1